MADQASFKIGAFFDGSPGHDKQTLGIIGQLKKRVAVDLVSIPVRRKSLAQQAADFVAYYTGWQKPKETSLKKCNILLGTGTPTHLPMLLQKRAYGIPVITCMTPATFLRKHCDLIFAPYHDTPPVKENTFPTLGPPTLNSNRETHEPGKTLVLIGGTDPRSHSWNTRQIVDGVRQLVNIDATKNYLLSSSPRTPEDTVTCLASFAEGLENVSFFDVHDTPPGWLEQQYAICKQVWVTGDSISMVYEALSSGCRVGIIPVQWRRRNSKFQMSENYLLEHGLAVHLAPYAAGKKTWAENREINEAQRCAEEIIKRFL